MAVKERRVASKRKIKVSTINKSTSKKTVAKKSKGAFTGSYGFKRARTEKKRADARKAKRMLPYRFRLPPGDEGKITITSEKPFFMYEHNWQDKRGYWSEYETCIQDTPGANCPLCQKLGSEGYYVMMLSVIDHRTYKDKNGKRHKNTKKILAVKVGQIPKFERIYKKFKSNLRGVRLHMIRDDDKKPAIGNDIEVLGRMSATKLSTFGEDAKPLDFAQAFPIPTEEELRRRYHVSDAAGSEDMYDDDDFDDGL